VSQFKKEFLYDGATLTRHHREIADKRVQSDVAASTAIISGIALKTEIIPRLLRSEIMKESVIYQEILMEGEARGEARGKTETANQIAQNMLRSDMSVDLIAQFTGLSLKQVQKLQSLLTQQVSPKKTTRIK